MAPSPTPPLIAASTYFPGGLGIIGQMGVDVEMDDHESGLAEGIGITTNHKMIDDAGRSRQHRRLGAHPAALEFVRHGAP